MKQQSIIDLIGWGLFVLIIYFVISALYGCGTIKSVDSDLCKHVMIEETCTCTKCGIKAVDPFTYSIQIVEPEFDEPKECNHQWVTCTVNPPFDKCMKCGMLAKDFFEYSVQAVDRQYGNTRLDDNLIEWHGYLIIDVGDSLVVLKNK